MRKKRQRREAAAMTEQELRQTPTVHAATQIGRIVRPTPPIMPRNPTPRAPIVPAMRRNQTPRVKLVRLTPIVRPTRGSPTIPRAPLERIARRQITALRRGARPPTGRTMQQDQTTQQNRTTLQDPATGRRHVRARRNRRSMRIVRAEPSHRTAPSQPNVRRKRNNAAHPNSTVRRNNIARLKPRTSLSKKTIRHTEGDNLLPL